MTTEGETQGRALVDRAGSHERLEPIRTFIDRAVLEHGNRPATSFCGRATTYRELDARVKDVAGVLRRLGAGPGATVAIVLPNCPAVAIYVLAAFETGATVLPLDPNNDGATLASDLSHCPAQVPAQILVTSDLAAMLDVVLALPQVALGAMPVVVVSYAAMLPMAASARLRLFSSEKFVRAPGHGRPNIFSERDLLRDKSAETVRATGATPRPAQLDDIALLHIQLQGGTRRVAALSQAQFATNLMQVRASLLPMTPGQERILAAVPLWHPLAYTLATMVALCEAAEIVILPEVTGAALVDAMRRGPGSIVVASAPLIGDLLADETLGPSHFARLKVCLIAGGTVTPGLRTDFAAKSRAKLLEAYAPAVAPLVACMTGLDDEGLDGGMRPLAQTRVVVRDFADLSREVPRGERGEVCLSGPQIVTGQHLSPHAGMFIGADLRTGDLGTVDAEGRLFVVDRIEDLIVAAGYLIYPSRIEAALLAFDGMIEAAVIGVGDGTRGTAPKAFVVVKRGLAVTERDLRVFLSTRISKIEMPADIDFRVALPRTPFGLVCKATLRARS